MSFNQQLVGILKDLQGTWTESTLIIGSIFILLMGLVKPSKLLMKGGFAISIVLALYFNMDNDLGGERMMNGIFISPSSIYFGSLFLLVSLLVLVFKREKTHAPEFYFFILAMLVGSLFIMKANSLLIIYVAIELVSLSSYILTNFSFKKKGFEAGIKYLLFGAMTSAVMLFGLGLIYGLTGTFAISEWSPTLFSQTLAQVGVLMLLIGIFFKISIMPAHLWVPGTYQYAPADATAFMSIVPKLAALVLMQRIFATGIFNVDHWIFNTVLILGIFTVIAGTLGAFRQTNARRMISFGAIAHSGFLLPFALMDTTTSQEAFWWYAVTYALMNLIVFYLLDSYERKQIENIEDYSKASESVWLGVCFTVALISLVGIPPLAGFTAKFFLFSALWEFYLIHSSNLILWYLVVAILATVGSLFYYLQISRNIFLVTRGRDKSINFSFSTKIVATLFSIALLLLFFAPKLVIVMQQLLNNVHE
ncbi:NADH-quinone oxidoreductase subunit N [Ekhidna sp.]